MIFRILAKNIANITKAAFYLSRITFCQKIVLEKKNSTLAVFQGKKLRSSARKCLEEISEGKILQKKVIRSIHWLWERKFQTFPRKFPAELSERHSTYPKDAIKDKKLWKYTVLWFSRTPRKTFWTLCEEFFAGLSIMLFTRPKGIFERNFCLKCALHIHGFQAIISADLLHKTFQ